MTRLILCILIGLAIGMVIDQAIDGIVDLKLMGGDAGYTPAQIAALDNLVAKTNRRMMTENEKAQGIIYLYGE